MDSERLTTAALLAIGLLGLTACGASDTLPEPEPELETPGAFVAQRGSDGVFVLLRTLDKLTVENQDTLLFFTVYDVTPKSWDDARELSKRASLPVENQAVTAFEKLFLETPHRVVWYRTLTDEERLR